MRKRNGRRRILPGEVKGLRLEIKRWRRMRTKRSPMPAKLWKRAAAVASKYGTSAVARTLGLDYKTLRTRTANAEGGAKVREARGAAGFIEMPPASWGGVRPVGTVLEMTDVGGTKLVLSLGSGGVAVDVMGLVEVFRRSAG